MLHGEAGDLGRQGAPAQFQPGDAPVKLCVGRFLADDCFQDVRQDRVVGQGSLHPRRTEYLVHTLFGDDGGRQVLEGTVVSRVRQLPGFADLTRITERINEICGIETPEVNAA
jgi:hypothetical protein